MTTKKRISFVRDILPAIPIAACLVYTTWKAATNLGSDDFALVVLANVVAVHLYLQGRYDGAKDMAEVVDPNREEGQEG